MGETVIFFREGYFYPVTLSGDFPTEDEVLDHVAINPGTTKVESVGGRIIWKAEAIH